MANNVPIADVPTAAAAPIAPGLLAGAGYDVVLGSINFPLSRKQKHYRAGNLVVSFSRGQKHYLAGNFAIISPRHSQHCTLCLFVHDRFCWY